MIRKISLILSCCLLLSLAAECRKIKIMKLNTPSIRIGGKSYQEGQIFDDEDAIEWKDDQQHLYGKYVDGRREIVHLTKAAFAQKKVKTPSQYFNKTNHPSTRDIVLVRGDYSDLFNLSYGKNKDKFGEKRVALVIGNSNYEYLPSLNNPINDCTDVSEKLAELGFDVYSLYDVVSDDFETFIKIFSGKAQDYDVAVIYYSGHGVEYDKHEYIIPTDVVLNSAEDLYQCIMLDDIYMRMNRTKCPVKLVFYDACRTEPEWKKGKGGNLEGAGIYTIYSTSTKASALDGEERNSPFTSSFLRLVGKPYESVTSMVDDMAVEVKNVTNQSQKVSGSGELGLLFTFVEKGSDIVKTDYSILNVTELENLAMKGDSEAYIPIAQYYLANAYGLPDYEVVYDYALKAWTANVNKDEVEKVFRKLEALGFFKVSDSKNPLK